MLYLYGRAQDPPLQLAWLVMAGGIPTMTYQEGDERGVQSLSNTAGRRIPRNPAYALNVKFATAASKSICVVAAATATIFRK
jgi:hypothetical protein